MSFSLLSFALSNQKTKKQKMKELSFFTENIWNELDRFDSDGNMVSTITCTEENMFNLYNSQFEDKTEYDQVFFYELNLDN
jgi:hypothetical protein